MGETKIGHTVIRVEEAVHADVPAIKTESNTNTSLTVLGSKMTQKIRTTIYCDKESRPLYEEFWMSSGGKTTQVYAVFRQREIDCRVITDSGERTKLIPIPEGVDLVGDSYNPVAGGKLEVGMRLERKSFNPLTLTLDDLKISVDREETIEVDGKKQRAVVILTKTPLADLTTYQSPETDELLRIDAAMGITMLRESREKAMGLEQGDYHPPEDFGVLTSVPTNMDLPDNGKLTRLQIKLSGIPGKSFVHGDERQMVQDVSGQEPVTATFLIRTAPFSAADAVEVPVPDEDLAPYLASDSYVDWDSPIIRDAARKITKGEKNTFRVGQAVRRWVNQEMKPRHEMGILRPASDIAKTPSGVCRDYSVLFAALARAAGVPAKIVGGLVYSRGGFYYHAWNEVWTGRSWVALDSTLSDDFVDATHIKLTEGDATDMFRLGKIVGQIKAEVLAYE